MKARPARQISRKALALVAMAVAALASPSAVATSAEPAIWELTPYTIRAYVALSDAPELTPRLAANLREAIVERVDSMIGSAWRLEAVPAPAELAAAMLRSLSTLSVDDLPAGLVDLDVDKLLLVTVTADHGVYQVAARDYDLRARRAGLVVTYEFQHRAKLADEAFRAMLTAFVPLARVEGMIEDTKDTPAAEAKPAEAQASPTAGEQPAAGAETAPPPTAEAKQEDKPRNKQALLRLRAAGLSALDPSIVWVQPGDVFSPLKRTNDRENKLKKIDPIDWTCLRVQTIAGGELTCNMYSGRRDPLKGRRRGRVEYLALCVRAASGSSRLELWSRGDGKNEATKRRLPGYEVFSHPPDSTKTVLIGRSDMEGAVTVPDDGGAVRVLLGMHGGEPLARLPLVPGVEPLLRAEIPDDDQRLEADGLVHALQENLVDLVARRQMFEVRCRDLIEKGKLDDARRIVDQMRRLGRQEDFLSTIRQQKERTYSAEKATQKKIDKLFDDTEAVVNRFLSNAQIDKLEQEINEKAREQPLVPAAGGG
ncbi:MAG TPA: hypothetical protein VGX76_11585 [Pirellulales bacterium]|nr:hypothetical protein [Pirellulales bacterium]